MCEVSNTKTYNKAVMVTLCYIAALAQVTFCIVPVLSKAYVSITFSLSAVIRQETKFEEVSITSKRFPIKPSLLRNTASVSD